MKRFSIFELLTILIITILLQQKEKLFLANKKEEEKTIKEIESLLSLFSTFETSNLLIYRGILNFKRVYPFREFCKILSPLFIA